MQHRVGQLIVGRLLEHGPAPYQFRAAEAASYDVKIATRAGACLLWGRDLERAVCAGRTRPKVGEILGARRLSREPVTVRFGPSEASKHTHRIRWEVEKVQHFAERIRLARKIRDRHADARSTVRQHPELVSAYLSLRGAEEITARRISKPEDRARFLALVREAMARSVARGEPLPEVRLKEQVSGRSPNENSRSRRPNDLAR